VPLIIACKSYSNINAPAVTESIKSTKKIIV